MNIIPFPQVHSLGYESVSYVAECVDKRICGT